MSKFTFNDRSSYLAYRAKWKESYKQLSAEIRELKIKRSQTNREYSKTPIDSINFKEAYNQFLDTLYELFKAQRKARSMLTELEEAKEESRKQYLQRRKTDINVTHNLYDMSA